MKTYRFYDPAQSLILPPSLDDWLPAGHLARYVHDVVDEMDLSKIAAYYEAEDRGAPPYHPLMMTKILVHGYCVGIRGSRKLEQACVDHVAFRFLAAGNLPKHSAIGEFRRIHLEALQGLFVQVLHLAQRSGFLKMGTVSIDGTKKKANAALDKNRTHEGLLKEEEAHLRRIAKEIFDEAERIDQAEDALYGDARGDELPEGMRTRKERLERIRKAKADLEREAEEAAKKQEEKIEKRQEKEATEGRKLRGRKPKQPDSKPREGAKRNITDPDSRIMKARQGHVQAYNAQAAVDVDSNLIVAADVTQECNDQRQMNPMLEQVKANTGKLPERAVLDAGYWNEGELRRAPSEVDLYVATTKAWKERKALRDAPPPRGRIPKSLSPKERMERKLRTKKGREVYKLRGQSVEPRFGCIQEEQKADRFLLRGTDKARGEWRLMTMAHNILRMWRMTGVTSVG